MTSHWLRKDNIWIEVGSSQLTANRSRLQGFSVLSDSSVVWRQLCPRGSTENFFFYSVIRLSNTRIHSSQGESLNIKNTQFFCCRGTIFFGSYPLCRFVRNTASKPNIAYEPRGIFAPGHLLLYCSSVSTTKTAVGRELRLLAARNHTSMTTSSAVTQVREENKLSSELLSRCLGCFSTLQGVRPVQSSKAFVSISSTAVAASWGQ